MLRIRPIAIAAALFLSVIPASQVQAKISQVGTASAPQIRSEPVNPADRIPGVPDPDRPPVDPSNPGKPGTGSAGATHGQLAIVRDITSALPCGQSSDPERIAQGNERVYYAVLVNVSRECTLVNVDWKITNANLVLQTSATGVDRITLKGNLIGSSQLGAKVRGYPAAIKDFEIH